MGFELQSLFDFKYNYMEYTESGSFSHNGKKYSLDLILKKARSTQDEVLNLDDFKWQLEFGSYNSDQKYCASCNSAIAHRERLKNVDTNIPIIVTTYKGNLMIVDGFHRFEKLYIMGARSFLCKKIFLE